jgi:hypothetical protein
MAKGRQPWPRFPELLSHDEVASTGLGLSRGLFEVLVPQGLGSDGPFSEIIVPEYFT